MYHCWWWMGNLRKFPLGLAMPVLYIWVIAFQVKAFRPAKGGPAKWVGGNHKFSIKGSILPWILTPSLAVWKALFKKEPKIYLHACDNSYKYFPFSIMCKHINAPLNPQICANIIHVNRCKKHLDTEESVKVHCTPLWRYVPIYLWRFHLKFNW